MRIYLMAAYHRHQEMQAVAQRLTSLGHTVTSRWIWGGHQASKEAIGTGTLGEFERRFAEEDMADLYASEICIGFSEPWPIIPISGGRHPRGGRHVELGMALAWQKEIIVVGRAEHVFHALLRVQYVPDHEGLYTLLAGGKP